MRDRGDFYVKDKYSNVRPKIHNGTKSKRLLEEDSSSTLVLTLEVTQQAD